MPMDSVEIDIYASCDKIFKLLHDYDRRLEWDPFLRGAYLLNGARAAALGVSSRCIARRAVGGLAMDTIYVTFKPSAVAAVKMTSGPRFLRSFAASIRQRELASNQVRVTYRYNFQVRPGWLAPLLSPIVDWVFHRETCRRLSALKQFLERQQQPDLHNSAEPSKIAS